MLYEPLAKKPAVVELARFLVPKSYVVSSSTTAVSLSDEQKKQLVVRLEETTKYESFEMNYQVDETLIGGMVIRIGDRVVDSSIKTKLYEMSRELRNIQV